MAIAQVQQARAEVAAREDEVVALRERQAALLQQVQMLSSVVAVALSREPRREQDDTTAARIAEVNLKLDRIETSLARSSKRPASVAEEQDIAAPRRAADAQTEERAAAVRKVQGMLEAGEVKLTTRNGRAQLWLMRPLDAQDPYRAAKKAEEQAPAKRPLNVPASPAAPPDEVRIEDPVRF
jgi:hypothetical protein